MTAAIPAVLQELIDRERIRDRMYRYSRGIDRCDPELLRTVFWPDATAECGTGYKGPAYGLIDWAIAGLRQLEQTMHMLGNILIEHHGALADVETYAHCYHRVKNEAGGYFDVVVGLRYVDRFTRRGDEWRIADRVMLYDWFREYEDSADWGRGFFGQELIPEVTLGGRKPNDRLYKLLYAGPSGAERG